MHLASHGFSAERYVKVFRAPLSHALRGPGRPRGQLLRDANAIGTPEGLAARNADGSPYVTVRAIPAQILDEITKELLANPIFVRRAADEVGDALFNGDARDRLRASLHTMLVARMVALGDAHATFDRVKKELAAPWRLQQDADGGPAKTSDVVSMGHLLLAEIKTAEDAVVKAVKLAMDEEHHRGERQGNGGPLDRFTGAHEHVPEIPANIPANEREAIRNLFNGLLSYAHRKREDSTVIVEATPPATSPTVNTSSDDRSSSVGDVPQPTTNETPASLMWGVHLVETLPSHESAISAGALAPIAFAVETPRTKSRGASADDPF